LWKRFVTDTSTVYFSNGMTNPGSKTKILSRLAKKKSRFDDRTVKNVVLYPSLYFGKRGEERDYLIRAGGIL
jgi:hypothetical protein